MLKEYQISNFKPFAGPVNIPIKPITLIFGANSSGKSAIFQSLLMLKQTLEEGRDPNMSLLPKGNIVDLGSFREFIHNHDVSNSFSFKMTFSFPKDIFEAFDIDSYDDEAEILHKSISSETIGLSVTFSWNNGTSNIMIPAIDLYIGNDPKPIITYKIGEKNKSGSYEYEFTGNFDHKYWHTYWECFDEKKPEAFEKQHDSDFDDLIRELEGMSDKEKEKLRNKLEEYNRELNELKLKGNERAVETYESFGDDVLTLKGFLPKLLNYMETKYFLWESTYEEDSRNPSTFALTVANLIRKFLNDIEYIAPLREYPERFYIYGGNPLESVGSSGKMVFDVLFNNPELLTKVNKEFKRFGTDYELRLSRLSSEAFEPQLYNKSTDVAASFRDVGFGFSQVLPVIVQSMSSKGKTLLIEQPELHLHPAFQAELGDLFIKSALGEQKNTFIIETHSEHLILRLLRRIRETTNGELAEGDSPLKPEDVAVIYAKPTEKGTELIELRITEDGDFADKWPDGFFAERAKELF